MPQDWLDVQNDVELPETVYLLCPGPSLADVLDDVDPSRAMVCNYAVTAKLRKSPRWFFAVDSSIGNAWWWHEAVSRLIAPEAPEFIAGMELYRALPAHHKNLVRYIVRQGPSLGVEDPYPHLGVVRPNATVAGSALGALWHHGTMLGRMPRVLTGGVDLYGGHYFDGTHPYPYQFAAWPQAIVYRALVDALAVAGMVVEKLPVAGCREAGAGSQGVE